MGCEEKVSASGLSRYDELPLACVDMDKCMAFQKISTALIPIGVLSELQIETRIPLKMITDRNVGRYVIRCKV